MAEDLRKYQPIWESLKVSKTVRISAHKSLHPRIKKAVQKEKDIDLLYKFEVSEIRPHVCAILRMTSAGSVITFQLIHKQIITIDSV
jgi:hypothetical protein